jgi:hypothetical protein
MKTFDTFNRLYVIKNKVDRAIEHQILNNLPIEKQREIFLFVKSLTLEETDNMTTVAVMNPFEMDKFIKLMEETGMTYDVEDVTISAILGEFKVEDAYIQNTVVDFFLEGNLTVDMVLDKIGTKGINYLSPIDKKILENS